ncbi:MAG: DUF4282 domain-containing protein [Proteobacteria bacterium]|nr:DUF4282 domain-containing protein [Pseudomonadota bacterium]
MCKKECIKKFYSFDEMITPVIIKAVFWILAIISIICGIVTIVHSFGQNIVDFYGQYQHIGGSFWLFIYGVLQIVLGVIFSKVFCEMILIIFKINENLEYIRKKESENKTLEVKAEEKTNE